MRLSELDYDLPPELIAQEPLEQRDQARLLVLDRRTGQLEHSRFYKLARLLREGDLLVLNNTRVFPARLMARKESGGAVELLLVRPVEKPAGAWLALTRTHRALKEGARLILENGRTLRVAGYHRAGRPIVVSDGSISIDQILDEVGVLALPHYIHRAPRTTDLSDYQAIYAEKSGAIAAPTAGLHFTEDLFRELAAAQIRTAFLTLHIGPAPLLPCAPRKSRVIRWKRNGTRFRPRLSSRSSLPTVSAAA